MIYVKSQDTPQIEVIIDFVKPDSVDVTSVGVLVCSNLVKTIVMGKFKQLQKNSRNILFLYFQYIKITRGCFYSLIYLRNKMSMKIK